MGGRKEKEGRDIPSFGCFTSFVSLFYECVRRRRRKKAQVMRRKKEMKKKEEEEEGMKKQSD